LQSFLKGICVIAFVLSSFGAANAQNFQGIYVGAYAGGNQGNSDAHTFTVFSPVGYFASTSVPAIATVGNQHLSPTGFSGGGTFGFNVQHHAFVFGAETDFGAMSLSASKTGTATYPCCAPTAFTVTQTINTDWVYTGRGRLGFAAGHVLFYGTGGLAATKLKYSELFTDTFAAAHESAAFDKARKGWIGGAGVEVRMSHHWSVKGEFLHADFGQEQTTSTNLTATFGPTTIPFPQNPYTHNADLTAHIFRGGLNYRF
jgi:outer membrane immunogenic protein